MATRKKTAKKGAAKKPGDAKAISPKVRRVIEELERYARMDNARGHELAAACAEALGKGAS